MMPFKDLKRVDICIYAAPFGVVPLTIDDVYPMSQFEIASPLDLETIDYITLQISNYIFDNNYNCVVLHRDNSDFGNRVLKICKKIF